MPNELHQPNVLCCGIGEYTTGFVGGGASPSDKKIGVVGLTMAWSINFPFFLSGAWLLVMGLIYNVPPVRAKELPYIDVLTESINNPIRLLLGWFAVTSVEFPPVSLLLSYWFVGAFFMASKRFSEYRMIADKAAAGAYRKSFRWYDEQKLLISMFFYVTDRTFAGQIALEPAILASFMDWTVYQMLARRTGQHSGNKMSTPVRVLQSYSTGLATSTTSSNIEATDKAL